MTANTPIGQLLTVVMYHYVRPLAQSAFPRLKALELKDFVGQLDWLNRHYSVISPDDLSAALTTGAELPARPCLLTFDDGYSDHFLHVFPELRSRGLKGLFFAPRSSLVERRVLEVNKIQFVLASQEQPEALADELDTLLRRGGLADPSVLRTDNHAPNRYDTADVAYVKRLLQHVLPAQTRSIAVDALFQRHVTADQKVFAEELYLTPAQAVEMRAQGMEFGGHGDLHLWHGQSSAEELQGEILGATGALGKIDAPVKGGFYCYPFGSHDAAVRAAVGSAGFGIGFTVEPALCDLVCVDPLQIPRLDTRDLPLDAQVPSSPWLEKAQSKEASR